MQCLGFMRCNLTTQSNLYLVNTPNPKELPSTRTCQAGREPGSEVGRRLQLDRKVIGRRSGSNTDFGSLVHFDPDSARSTRAMLEMAGLRWVRFPPPQQFSSESRFSQFRYQYRCSVALKQKEAVSRVINERLLSCWQTWILTQK